MHFPCLLMYMSYLVCTSAGLAVDGNELYSVAEDGSMTAWDLRTFLKIQR